MSLTLNYVLLVDGYASLYCFINLRALFYEIVGLELCFAGLQTLNFALRTLFYVMCRPKAQACGPLRAAGNVGQSGKARAL